MQQGALWHFGALSPQVRPLKVLFCVQNLLPCLEQIARRPEELLHEALAPATERIFEALGTFSTEAEVKVCSNMLNKNLANLLLLRLFRNKFRKFYER